MSHLNINGVDKPLDHIRLNNVRTEQLASSYNATGYLTQYNAALFAEFDIKPNTEYTLSFDALQGAKLYSNEHIFTSSAAFVTDGSRYHVTLVTKSSIPEDQHISGLGWLLLKNALTLQSNPQISNVMLNLGSTALPYQPYRITKEAWEAKSRVILHGLTNPLCGIDTYKDTLDLSTGPLTRNIGKLVLTGNETWIVWNNNYYSNALDTLAINASPCFCTHFINSSTSGINIGANASKLKIARTAVSDFVQDVEGLKQWLAAQYSSGTPVTVWYVLTTPTTETITLPSNLTGIVEGYLTQSSTPSPTSPVYPTANGTLEQGGTYSLDTGAYAITWGRADTFTGTNSISARCYGLPVKSWEIDGNSQQSGTPAQDDPIMPDFVGERTANRLNFKEWASNVYVVRGTATVSGNSIAITSSGNQCFTGWNNTEYPASARIPVTAGDVVTLSWTCDVDDESEVWIFPNGTQSGNLHTRATNGSLTYTVPAGTTYLTFRLDVLESGKTFTFSDIMLNTGSTAKTFEPYGWAIEIEVT